MNPAPDAMSATCDLSLQIGLEQAYGLRRHDSLVIARLVVTLSPNSRDAQGNGPLHLACQPADPAQFSLDFLRETLSWAPSLDLKNQAGWTPLGLAVLFLPAPAVRLLVQMGSCESPDALQDALLLAANYERPDVAGELLDSGKVHIQSGYRNEQLAFARRFERHSVNLRELVELAGRYPVLDRHVARMEQTDDQTLSRLAVSEDRPTLRSVAGNPNTPSDVLFKLAPRFPRPFFRNPMFDWLMLEEPDRIFELGKGVIRNIIRLKDCPKSMIQWAVTHGGDAEMLAVIRRGDAPAEMLQAIAERSSGRVRALAIANNPESSVEALSSAVGVDPVSDRLIAVHQHCQPELLVRLRGSNSAGAARFVHRLK